MRKISGMLCLVLVGGLVGCNQSQLLFPEGEGPGGPDQYEAALKQAKTCDEVLQAIQEDAIAKVALELRAFEEQQYYGSRVGGPGVVFDAAEGAGPQPPSAAGDGDANAAGAESPTGVSDTNRQVADVDEADIVKVGDEGRKLYVIRGKGFHEFDSWPASQTSKVADLEIEGGPIEMFVEGDRAVVFSNVYGIQELDDGDLCQGYGYGPELADFDAVYYCGRSYVKITTIALDGDSPVAIQELYVDGWYTSSRRHDNIVRTVVQSNMQQPGTVPYLWDFLYADEYPATREEELALARAWAAEAKEAILQTTLEHWLPVWGKRVDGEIQEQPVQCTDFYSPSPGLTNYGLTQIVGIDVGSDEDPQITSILGSATTVYANAEAMVLLQPDYHWDHPGADRDRTAVHRFAVSFEQQRTPYQGSGFVQGTVHDQFSIDERDGIIRIATTRTRWPDENLNLDVWIPPVTDNLVSTMKLNEGKLEVMGKTPGFAEGETIFAVRFIEDLCYVVTFRRIDPLFAIDLSDPENPKILGALKIPGFSDYMHPLGDNHLLTIGREVEETTQIDRGVALQIFRVTDPTKPELAHKVLVGEGYSEANVNHKAFNFYADKGLLAFPFVSYEGSFLSTLELWDVDTTNGFNRRGAVDHSDLLVDGCGGWVPPVGGAPLVAEADFIGACGYRPQVTRGVFISSDTVDYIYSISDGGIKVHDVDDLDTTVATATY